MPEQTTQQITEWLAASGRELGLEDAAEGVQGLDAADLLAVLVGEHVDPAAVTSTVFLLGVAAGRTGPGSPRPPPRPAHGPFRHRSP